MLPFDVQIKPGLPVFEQIRFAVVRAVVSGQLRPGDPFPSVRTLSQELKINPNTAQKAVSALKQDGLLEVMSGVGTVIAWRHSASSQERKAFLGEAVENLVVQAKKLDVGLNEIVAAITSQWEKLK